MQRNNGSDQRFPCGPFQWWRHCNNRGILKEVFSLWSAPRLYTEVHRACKIVFDGGTAPVKREYSACEYSTAELRGQFQKRLSCCEVWSVILCNCIVSNKSSWQSNTRLQSLNAWQYCDMHAVGLRDQQRKNALPWQRTHTWQWKRSEARHRKYKRLKLGGGQAYDRSND
jgi:hypothetical protein